AGAICWSPRASAGLDVGGQPAAPARVGNPPTTPHYRCPSPARPCAALALGPSGSVARSLDSGHPSGRTSYSSSQSSIMPRARGALKPSCSRRERPRSAARTFFFVAAGPFLRLLGSRRSSQVCRSTGGGPPPMSFENVRIGGPPGPAPSRGGGGRRLQEPL